jgi:hypothetical protein
MIWLAPWALALGGAGMLGVVAAHLLSRQRPRALALATTRFLPVGILEATTVQRVPMDRWWMLLRLCVVALLAAGVAQPVFTGTTVPQRTVLLLDRTLPVEAQRSALASLADGDVVVAYDTTARVTPVAATMPATARDARLSAAFAALVHVRDSLAAQSATLRVAIASTFQQRSLDPATPTLRALLPDSVVVLPVSVAADSAPDRAAVLVRVSGDDPIAATARLLGDRVARRGTVLQRGAELTADDSVALRNGATVVWWPSTLLPRAPALRAVTVGAATWIAPFDRDSVVPEVRTDRAIGWWADGTPAVWRADRGAGCLLRVGIAVPAAGDQTLSLAAQRWLAALLTSCDAPRDSVSPAPPWLPAPTVRSSVADERQSLTSRSAVWLIGAALSLALLELVLRRRRVT